MSGAIGSTFGGSGIWGLVWIALWLVFGPVMFLRLLFSSRRFRERNRNMWWAAGITLAPILFAACGRLLG
ncbi:MAG TPA: hypothetical protein VF928_05550 [Usitatibacteraceae bacterium]